MSEVISQFLEYTRLPYELSKSTKLPSIHLADQVCRQRLLFLNSIDSRSNHPAGVRSAQELLALWLEPLGFEITWIWPSQSSGPNDKAPMLHAKRKGQVDQNVLLVGHADTCRAPADVATTELQSSVWVGPGLLDDKGGLVTAVQIVTNLVYSSRDLPNLTLISSPSEELGSPGFHEFMAQVGSEADVILGFEPAAHDGDIIISRRGNRWYEVTFTGTEAHAGRTRGEHVDALLEAAHKIVELSSLGSSLPGASVICSSLHTSHSHFNITCGSATLKVDTRFETEEQLQFLHSGIESILNKWTSKASQGPRVPSISYVIKDDCPPFARRSNSVQIDSLLNELNRAYNQMELSQAVKAIAGGGASDINYLCRAAKKAQVIVDGLGPSGGRMHQTDEFINVRSMAIRAQAISRWLIEALNRSDERSRP